MLRSIFPGLTTPSSLLVARAISLAALGVLPACSKARPVSRPANAQAQPAVTTPSTPSAAPALVQKDDIPALFRAEAASRPAHTARVEDVLAAFESSGVQVSDVRQHLAKPFGADYCAGAEASRGVVLSVCEYRSPAAATAGRIASAKGLASIPNRQITQNGATTLTLRDREHSATSRGVVESMQRAFAALKT
jgi:hypothetical protein